MGIKQLYNDNLRKLLNEYTDVSVMFISSIFRLLCIALWHYVHEHIIYTVYSGYVLVFAFAFLSCKQKCALNRTFSTESCGN